MITTTSQFIAIVREFSRWAIMILAVIGIGVILATLFLPGEFNIALLLGRINPKSATITGKAIALGGAFLFLYSINRAYHKDLLFSFIALLGGWSTLLI